MLKSIFTGLALFVFISNPASWAHAAEEIDAYCVVPKEAVPHGSTVALTIKFSDSDKSNDLIVQGPFKILKYENGKPVIVDFKRGNDKDDKGKENSEKPTLTFNVSLTPKHKLSSPAVESVTFAYFVKHKEGKREELFTTNHEQQVDCSFTVQHEIEKSTTPSGGNMVPADLEIGNVGTLPTSRWYFLKEWRRNISRLFTFNSIAKAELELKIANEKAAEALQIQETKPDDAGALAIALENYTRAAERLRARLTKLKETSENPNVEKLIEKLDEQTLKHALLLNQLVERWSTDPYGEDANVVNPRGIRDNHLQGAVDTMQKKIQEIVVAAAQKDKNREQKAEEQIQRADVAIHEFESELAEFAINEPGVPNNRMKAGLDTADGMLANARAHLTVAKLAFAEGKYGEAFGTARAAEVLARNGLRILGGVLRADTGGLEDGGTKSVPSRSGTMPIVPGTGSAGEKVAPEEEKRVFPETNNRTACDDRQAPGCLRGEILECHDGKWTCIGPATREGQILNPTQSPSTDSNLLPAAKEMLE